MQNEVEIDSGIVGTPGSRGGRGGFRNLITAVTGRRHRPRTKAERRSDVFKTLVALMLAVVTIASALVAWRSSMAGTNAGDAENSGLIAALNLVDTSTAASITTNQHRAAHLDYQRDLQTALSTINDYNKTHTAGNINETEAKQVLQEVTNEVDLAITEKRFTFLDPRYLNRDDTYDSQREQAEYLAEQAQRIDIEPDKWFAQADEWRETSVAFIATLILLGVSLWLFALAETFSSAVKFAAATGGVLFFVLGCGVALAIEMNQPLDGPALGRYYDMSVLLAIIAGAITLLATAIFTVVAIASRRRPILTVGHPSVTSRQSSVDDQPIRDAQPANHNGESAAGDEGDTPGEARFKEVVTVLIASVALFGAIVAWLQADANARSSTATRNAESFAAQALGQAATGEAQVSYDYGAAARAWKELDVLATSADKAGDTQAAARYRSVRDEVAGLSKILSKPYFDTSSAQIDSIPDLASYEADLYLAKKTEYSEQSAIQGDFNNEWEGKANNYTIHLTLLAAALALFGLSMALSGMVRPIFASAAVLITLVTLVWTYGTFTQRINTIPLEAVQAYAQGTADAYHYDYDNAIKRFSSALAITPDYANALSARGDAYFNQGKYDAAARDYQAAYDAGKTDYVNTWNLGWTLYLLGKYDQAISYDQLTLENDPTQTGVRLNLALAYLASGQVDQANATYKVAMDHVTNQVLQTVQDGQTVAPSIWFYIDAGAHDLESLDDQLNDKQPSWDQAPPKSAIADPFVVEPAARDMFNKLKSLTVALEYTHKPPADTAAPQIGEMKFATKASDQSNDLKFNTTFTQDDKDILIVYNYNGMHNGQKVVYKVYIDGQEYPEFRLVDDWGQGKSGQAQVSFSEDIPLSDIYSYYPGDYIVEMYVDSHLVQRGTFTIK